MGVWTTMINLLTWRGDPLPATPAVTDASWDVLDLKAAGTPAAPAVEPLAVFGGGGPLGAAAWIEDDRAGVVRESFRIAGIVFRAGTLVADAFAEAPMRVYRDQDGTLAEERGHRLRMLFAEPNPEQAEQEFWNVVILIAFLHGHALIEKVRDRAGEVVRLYPRTPDSMTRVKQRDGVFVWEQRTRRGDVARRLPDADVFAVPYQFDPSLRRRGITPVDVLGREIGIDVALTTYLKAFIEEGGIPPFVAKSKDPFAEQTQPDVLRLRWGQKFGGGEAWRAVPFLAGVDIEKVGLDFDEMAFPELKGITELRIAQALGVPAHLLGAKEAIQNGGLATTEVKQAMAFFQEYTIEPLRGRVAAAITRAVLREAEPDRSYLCDFDTRRVKALQEDETRKHERVRADVQAGIVTVQEARPALGYPADPASGETYLRPFAVMEVVAGQSPEPTPPAPTKGTPSAPPHRYRDTKTLNVDALAVRTTSIEHNRRGQAKLTSLGDRLLRKFWREQGRRLAELLADAGAKAVALAELDWAAEERLLADLLTRFYAKAGEVAFADAADLLGVELDWSLANPNVGRTMDRLGTRIRGIAETTRADVARAVADWSATGGTLDDLAGALTGLFDETYRSRAMTVARTESMYAYGLASAIGYEMSGIVSDIELADNPEHTEDYGASDGLSCARRNGMVVPLADAEKHLRAEHPNGTLAILPVIGEE